MTATNDVLVEAIPHNAHDRSGYVPMKSKLQAFTDVL